MIRNSQERKVKTFALLPHKTKECWVWLEYVNMVFQTWEKLEWDDESYGWLPPKQVWRKHCQFIGDERIYDKTI